MNYDGVASCRRCGSSFQQSGTVYGQGQQNTPYGTVYGQAQPNVPYHASNTPYTNPQKRTNIGSPLLWGGLLIVLSFVFTTVGLDHHARQARCVAVAQGELEDEYVVETKRSYGIATSTKYHVYYTFQVNGQKFKGNERLESLPEQITTPVYYNPADPDDNLLIKQPMEPYQLVLSLGAGVLGIGIIIASLLRRRSAKEIAATY